MPRPKKHGCQASSVDIMLSPLPKINAHHRESHDLGSQGQTFSSWRQRCPDATGGPVVIGRSLWGVPLSLLIDTTRTAGHRQQLLSGGSLAGTQTATVRWFSDSRDTDSNCPVVLSVESGCLLWIIEWAITSVVPWAFLMRGNRVFSVCFGKMSEYFHQ